MVRGEPGQTAVFNPQCKPPDDRHRASWAGLPATWGIRVGNVPGSKPGRECQAALESRTFQAGLSPEPALPECTVQADQPGRGGSSQHRYDRGGLRNPSGTSFYLGPHPRSGGQTAWRTAGAPVTRAAQVTAKAEPAGSDAATHLPSWLGNVRAALCPAVARWTVAHTRVRKSARLKTGGSRFESGWSSVAFDCGNCSIDGGCSDALSCVHARVSRRQAGAPDPPQDEYAQERGDMDG